MGNISTNNCANCKAVIRLHYCENCGQKTDSFADRSLKKLVGKLFTNLFFLDNRIWVSLRYLIFKPGKMTAQFLNGQRKKFLNPISLFLFVNVLFFFISPLQDYHLSLVDQIKHQYYSPIADNLVRDYLTEENISLESFEIAYNKKTTQVSKLLMILNIPLIALFIYPVFRRKQKFYYDSLIIVCHYFTFFLFMVVGLNLLLSILENAPNWLRMTIRISLLFALLTHFYLSVRTILKPNKFINIILALYLFLAIFLAQGIYRAIIFFATYIMVC